MRTVNLCITFLFLSIVSLGQTIQTGSVLGKNIISVYAGYPIPASGSTFNRIYEGVFDVRLGYSMTKKKISLGGDLGYSYFRISPRILDIGGKMTILTPGITAGYEFKVFNKMVIRSLLKCGYDFIAFSGTDADGNFRPVYHDGGISLLPIVSMEYFFNKNIGIGLSGSYEIIFQHFGNNSVWEESTIRIMDFGIKIIYEL